MKSMVVNIDQLQQITDQLLSGLRKRAEGEVDFNVDDYWELADSERYYAFSRPKQLTIGQLSEDWASVVEASEKKCLTSNDMRLVANVLHALGVHGPSFFADEEPTKVEKN